MNEEEKKHVQTHEVALSAGLCALRKPNKPLKMIILRSGD